MTKVVNRADIQLSQVIAGILEGLPGLVDGRLDAFPGISVVVDPGLDSANRVVAEHKLLQLLDFGDIIGVG